MTDRPSSTETGTFFIAAIALSLAAWPIAFNLGAYNTIFVDHLLQVWAASLAALLAGIIAGRTAEGEQYFSWWGSLLLLMPTIWIVVEVLLYGYEDDVSSLIRLITTAATVGLALPYIGYMIISAAVPEAMEIHHPRLIGGLMVIVLLIAAMAYLVGYYNYAVMTCADFDISGAALPKNCWSDQ